MLCKKTPFKVLEKLSESLLKIPGKKETSKEPKKEELEKKEAAKKEKN